MANETVHRCQGCQKLLVKEVPQPGNVPSILTAAAVGVVIDRPPGSAPRVRCPCGMATVLLKGKP